MTKRFLYVMATLSLGLGAARGGEEYMPLMPGPGAYAHTEVGVGASVSATRRITSNDADVNIDSEPPQLQRNVVKLTLPPAPTPQPARLRMVEATETGPDGILTFQPTQTLPGTRHADIPGLVPPEVLALTHMPRSRAGGVPAPIALPHTLSTEELGEFAPQDGGDEYNAYRDAMGFAGAFPAASMSSRALGSQVFRNDAVPGRPAARPAQAAAESAAPGGVSVRRARSEDIFPLAPPPPRGSDDLLPLTSFTPATPRQVQLPEPLDSPSSTVTASLFELPDFPPFSPTEPESEPEPVQMALATEEAVSMPETDVVGAGVFAAAPVNFAIEDRDASELFEPFGEEWGGSVEEIVWAPEPLFAAAPPEDTAFLAELETRLLPEPAVESISEPAPISAAVPSYSPPPPAPLPELPMPTVSSPLPRPAERPLRPSATVPAPVAASAPRRDGLGISAVGSLVASSVKRTSAPSGSLRPPAPGAGKSVSHPGEQAFPASSSSAPMRLTASLREGHE